MMVKTIFVGEKKNCVGEKYLQHINVIEISVDWVLIAKFSSVRPRSWWLKFLLVKKKKFVGEKYLQHNVI